MPIFLLLPTPIPVAVPALSAHPHPAQLLSLHPDDKPMGWEYAASVSRVAPKG